MRRVGLGVVLSAGMLMGVAAGAEGVCFRTVEEAMRRSGVMDGAGFRMEGVAWDVFQGTGWARVRSCGHPERPVMLVRGNGGRPLADAHLSDGEAVAKVGHRELAVRAGAVVTVVSVGEQLRMEFSGRAVEGGAVGDRVRVRVGADGAERMVVCVARGADVLEVVQ